MGSKVAQPLASVLCWAVARKGSAETMGSVVRKKCILKDERMKDARI